MKQLIAVISPRSIVIGKNFSFRDIQKKFRIIYLDCSFIFGNKIIKKKNTILIKRYFDLFNFLNKNKKIYVLDLLSFNFKFSTNILRLILRFKSNPILYVHGLRTRPKTNFKNNSIFEIVSKFKNYCSKLFFQNSVFRNHIIFTSGKYREKIFEKLSDKKINYIISKDYFKLKNIQKHFKPFKSYAVFIDENVPNHYDYKISNIKSPISKRKYYEKLKLFFRKIEKIYKTKVVISLHPKSKLNKIKELKGFKIYKGQTEKLIKNSSFVMFHASTAISYAVILNKPILSLTCNEFNRSYFINEIKQTSKLLSTTEINIDELDKLNFKKLKVSKLSYKKYINHFIKHPKSNEKSIENYLVNFKN